MSTARGITGPDPNGAHASASLLLILAGALAIGINVVMLTRMYTPQFDEVYFVTASESVLDGEPAVPWLQINNRTPSLDEFYGPLFFRMEAAILRVVGVSIYVGRGLSLGGTVLLAIACAAAIRAAGAPRPWPAAGFALALWAPEIFFVMTGRMDQLSVAGGIFGIAAYVAGIRRHELRESALLAVIGGVAFGGAVLLTPRAGLIPVAMAAASPLLLLFGFDRSRVIGLLAITTVTALLIASLGLMAAGVTWTGWVRNVLAGTLGTADVSALFGGQWYTGNATRMAPLPLSCAMLAGIALWRDNPRGARGIVAFGLGIATVATILTALAFGDPFNRSVQHVNCWIITGLIAAGTLLKDRGRQAAMALGIVGLACVAFRVHRYLEVAESWSKRDPRPVEEFLRTHVPRGATVYTGWPYFFALHSIGARVESYRLSTSRVWTWSPTGGAPPLPHETRFLVLADRDEDALAIWPNVNVDCATSNRVAVFEPAPLPTEGLLARLPIHTQPGALRGYARTFLYQLPDGCDIR